MKHALCTNIEFNKNTYEIKIQILHYLLKIVNDNIILTLKRRRIIFRIKKGILTSNTPFFIWNTPYLFTIETYFQ